MKNNIFLKTLLLVSLAWMVGSSNAETISEGTSTISRTFYRNDGTPLQGVKVIVTKAVKDGRIISRAVDRAALSARDEASLANAHTKALDSNFVLLIPPDYPAAAMTFTTRDTALKLINYATINITASDTIPTGASVVMAGKGRFDISSGKTLTFAGGSRFDGGMQRCFVGAGMVVFGNGSVDRLNAAWFGAQSMSETGGNLVDNVRAIRKAITVYNNSISDSKRQEMEIYLPPGIYHISDSLLFSCHDTVIDFEGKLRPYGNYAGYLVVIKGNDETRTAKYPGQHNRARLSIKQLRLDGLHQSKGIRIEDMMHALLSEIHLERISGAAFKASRFKESVITNLNIHTSKASTDPALLWLDGETSKQDANNGLVFVNPKIEYSGGCYVYISTGSTTSLPRNIDFYSPQFHHLDVTAQQPSHGIKINSGDIVVQIIKGRDIRFFGGNIRIPASPYSRCVSIGNASNAPQRIHFYGTVISNTATKGGMGISVKNAGRIHVEDVTDDVTADSLYISPQIYRRSENNPLVVTFNGKVRSKEGPSGKRVAQPGILVARTDLQSRTRNVLEIADTSAIALNVERDTTEGTPYLEFYSNHGGAGWISIVGDKNNGVMRYQKAARHQFDNTISLYSSTPRLGLTDTDVNRVTTSVAQAEDTTSIVLDASTTTPSITTKDNAGRTIFTANSSGNLGIGIGVSPAGRFDVDNDADGTRDSSFVINTNGGVVVGNPTGGNKGPGTVNAKAVYDDNVQLTDFVFEPDYNFPSIDSMRAFYDRHKHLPTIPGRGEWKEGKFAVGNLLNYLWETVEVQARYIAELNERLKKVETSR